MNELLQKLSSYNLFNYLLPGVVFVALAEYLTAFSFVQDDLILAAFVYYFIGLVISRFGSLVLEPIFRRIVPFAPYEDFVDASKVDSKIELFSEVNNSYRTYCSLFVLLLLLKLYEWLVTCCPPVEHWTPPVLIAALLALFLCSYGKQTNYVKKRVNNAKKASS